MLTFKELCKENRGFLVFVVLMFMFRSAIADWNHVPTGSMLPTIKIGDRILVNKMAYDVRAPFSKLSLYRHADPMAGDIVIFESQVADNRLVKRVIAVPGDKVSMYENKLTINDKPLGYSGVLNSGLDSPPSIYWEKIAPRVSHGDNLNIRDEDAKVSGLTHQIQLIDRNTPLSNFTSVTVPSEHYLVLGDNRNNSADSRVIGFVPREEIIGRARSVVMSFNYENYYLPRANRFFKSL